MAVLFLRLPDLLPAGRSGVFLTTFSSSGATPQERTQKVLIKSPLLPPNNESERRKRVYRKRLLAS